MIMYEIIKKKRDGFELTKEEIDFFVQGYTKGDIPDYQASALLMAIFLKGMTIDEITNLTMSMTNSGEKMDLSEIDGIKVDKHSTGGVGDKTTLIIAPILACLGVKVAKMSGKGLGHTGGTVDKLSSIPGFKVELSKEEFIKIVKKTGVAVIGQSKALAPADKKIYALRDVTATVDTMPLIASSIMSKKLASGSDCLLLDVKVGTGAFIKTLKDAKALAKIMVDIGNNSGKICAAVITDMDMPLGNAVGNNLEVIEAVKVLNNKGPKDLTEECIVLSTELLCLAKKYDYIKAEDEVRNILSSGTAFKKFCEMVEAQGGDVSYILDTSKFDKAKLSYDIKAKSSGFITKMNTELIGFSSGLSGAGRQKIDDKIDFTAGIIIKAKTGDKVCLGDVIATLYSNNADKLKEAENLYIDAITISDKKPYKKPLILAKVR